MTLPEAYLNGRFLPASEAALSVTDNGVVQGTTISEVLRTFAGRLFRLDDHLARLYHSLEIIGVEPQLSRSELSRVAEELVSRNHPVLANGDDLGLTILVTPGVIGSGTPTVCLHTFPLRFDTFAAKYSTGEHLATTDVVQVSPRSWPAELKCRSRMHYYLADRQAEKRFPGSRALMRDEDGFITETTTANIAIYRVGEGLLMPPRDKVLPGISLATVLELAESLGIPHRHCDLSPSDAIAADEMLLMSTSPCVLPVVRLDENQIGPGVPGPVFGRLLAAWSARVGHDIAAQAVRFSA